VTVTTSDTWADHLDDELAFWRHALSDPGPDGDVQRERATRRAVWDEFRRRVPENRDPVRMLDVGSGPLTTLGTEWPGRTVEIVAVDPLAEPYGQLLAEVGIDPPVPPRAIRGEHLLEHFPQGSFDVVHAANSLDHTADPVLTLQQMLGVARPGGVVCLIHHIDVGELEDYHGLHQWNLRPQGEHDMAVWSRDRTVLLSELAPDAGIDVEQLDGGLFRVWVQTS
jgi:SAM-dependent methyltransferase